MRIHTSDKIIAYLTLLSGLTISAVAIYYSVAGLVAIFSAAMIPIIVMGVVLEVSKLIATVWLKINWSRAPILIRTYLTVAIAILMVITSLGIFGFLSKAHSDQSLVGGDVQSRIAIYDEKIKTAKDNIDANRKALKQMDEAVDQVMGRSSDEKGADKAVAIRRGQQKERARLQAEIAAEQKIVSQLSEERAPIAAEVRKVEAEVGPIKYIAAFIYGDNPDANILEKAVTWVIVIIVVVFDPLAVILLLASQYSFQWFRRAREEEEEQAAMSITPAENIPGVELRPFTEEEIAALDDTDLVEEANAKLAEIEPEVNEFIPPEETEEKVDEKKPIDEWNEMIAEAEKAVEQEQEKEDHEILEAAEAVEKTAMAAWKHDNPNDSLKRHRKLFEKGIITVLPWENYLKPVADFTDDEAAEEAAKWAQEQIEKKKDGITWIERDENGEQVKKILDGYQQNAEQSESTLWQRVKKAKDE